MFLNNSECRRFEVTESRYRWKRLQKQWNSVNRVQLLVGFRQRPLLDRNSREVLLLDDTYHLLQLHSIFPNSLETYLKFLNNVNRFQFLTIHIYKKKETSIKLCQSDYNMRLRRLNMFIVKVQRFSRQPLSILSLTA